MHFCDRERVRRALEGRSVAVVGSGPGVLSNKPRFVDSHQVVVRVNNYVLSDRAGHRADVHYSFYGSSIKKTAAELAADGVKLCICKCPDAKFMESKWHRQNGKHNGVDFRYVYQARRDFWFCDTYVPSLGEFMEHFELLGGHVPTTGFAAILEILAHRPRELYVTGFDFFASRIHNVDQAWRPVNTSDPIRHVPEVERQWLAANLEKYPIRLDPALTELMRKP